MDIIDIKELHEFDGPISAFYAKGSHDLFDFIEALEVAGALDYAEEHASLMECIDWQWWRWIPTNDGWCTMGQAFCKKLVPQHGAFQVTVFWINPIDGCMGTRWNWQRDMNLLIGKDKRGSVML